jgi:DNA polymerase III delta prime subunit
MEHNLFIHKFQPLYFNDFEMETNMSHILNTLISIDSINILFTGSIGSGKTILLNALIREYYKDFTQQQYRDHVLYINNLKEQGISYYRNEVKTFCQMCSSIKHKKKIVVLDDIDLINEQSQQVFRNYIDKYSHNVNFIASCTNIQKVIESLQSRFTSIKIKPLQNENLYKIMKKIAEKEEIKIEPEAHDFIISICNNTAKILINYMEKFKLLKQDITLEMATKVCTNINFNDFDVYTKHLKEKNLQKAIKLLYEIYDKGYSVMDILDNYFLFVKTTNLLSEVEKYKIVPYICKYITIFHNVHEDEIELALFTNNILTVFDSE